MRRPKLKLGGHWRPALGVPGWDLTVTTRAGAVEATVRPLNGKWRAFCGHYRLWDDLDDAKTAKAWVQTELLKALEGDESC